MRRIVLSNVRVFRFLGVLSSANSHLRRLIAAAAVLAVVQAYAAERPNVLWLSTEDMSPNLGCYGDDHARTPNIDALAANSVVYENAFVPSPVCATCRSSIITGVYSTALGAHHMRSRVVLPPEMRCFTEYLREAGYYCTNNAKEDYNFQTPAAAWDESSRQAHWRHRPQPDQPFFAVFNFTGTHESSVRGDEPNYRRTIASLQAAELRDPASLELPPYYPDTPQVRDHWARYYNTITALDKWVAERLAELQEAGLAEDTVVFFWSDHGAGLPRAKRWLYDSGLRVPLIVRIPEKFRVDEQSGAGIRSPQLVSLIDLGPTVLNLASLPIPAYMQGQPFLGEHLPAARQYVYGSRDRMDESYDAVRCVRDRNYKYIRNFMPWRPYAQYQSYGENNDIMRELRRLDIAGKLTPDQALFMRRRRPVEELYDLDNDPHELRNLAADRSYEPIRQRLAAALFPWMQYTRDLGLLPEGLMHRQVQPGQTPYGRYRRVGGEDEYQELLVAALAGSAAFANRPEDDPRWRSVGLLTQYASPKTPVAYWGATAFAAPPLLSDASTRAGVRGMESAIHKDPALRMMTAEMSLSSSDESVRTQAVNTLLELYESAPTPWDQVAAANAIDLAPDFESQVAAKLADVNDRVRRQLRTHSAQDLPADTLGRWVRRFDDRLGD